MTDQQHEASESTITPVSPELRAASEAVKRTRQARFEASQEYSARAYDGSRGEIRTAEHRYNAAVRAHREAEARFEALMDAWWAVQEASR